ncbi:Alcohol dehydrogenase transcription factor Myb/SANT-like [Popillia japonica]|uniref:Alcohol dehydrogenase transcription factor Myb/SANT-like n=1 Tax=Popillia japonica TaxID=7064 RepID=A0AAW1M1A5_POPJA
MFRNNLTKKLTSSKWGTNSLIVKSTAGEYASRSAGEADQLMLKKARSSLRDCFRRELSLQPSRSSAKHRRKYMYFDQLRFLLPCTQMSDTESSLADTENEPLQLETPPAGPSLQISSAKKQRKINYDEEIVKVLKEDFFSEETEENKL